MPRRNSQTGDTRVKVSRLALIERVEEILSEDEKRYEQEMSGYEEDLDNWMEHAKRALSDAVTRANDSGEFPHYLEGRYDKGPAFLVEVPDRPQEPRRKRDAAGVLRMLKMNPEETITISQSSYLHEYLEDQDWE